MKETENKEGQHVQFSSKELLEFSMLVQLCPSDSLKWTKFELNDPIIKHQNLRKLLVNKHYFPPYIIAFLFSPISQPRRASMSNGQNRFATHYFQTRQKLSAITQIVLFVATKRKLLRKLRRISTSLNIQLLYMSLYPNVQEKIQREINFVINNDRLPI